MNAPDMNRQPSILITGGTGLLGKGLVETAPEGWRIVVSHLRDYKQESDKAETVVCDILDMDALDRLFSKHHFDYVIHCAGMANVDFVETNYEISRQSNVTGTKNIIEMCRRYGTSPVYISTNGIFDGEHPLYAEDDVPRPLSLYGKLKVECEELVKEAFSNCIIARPILMYGWNSKNTRQNPVSWIVKELRGGKTLNIVDDVHENPVYNVQAGEMIWALIKNSAHGTFHIAGGEIINRYFMALKTADVFGLDRTLINRVDSSFFKTITPRPRNTSFSVKKIWQATGIKPLSLTEGLLLMKKTEPAHE